MFIQQVFGNHLLYISHCSRGWRYSNEKTNANFIMVQNKTMIIKIDLEAVVGFIYLYLESKKTNSFISSSFILKQPHPLCLSCMQGFMLTYVKIFERKHVLLSSSKGRRAVLPRIRIFPRLSLGLILQNISFNALANHSLIYVLNTMCFPGILWWKS